MKVLTNRWYVACPGSELDMPPVAKIICGQPVVLFRNAQGKAAIISNVCPHRKAPLSMGNVHDGILTCKYHGMAFNESGHCVHIPSQSAIPPKAHIRSYPAMERYGFVWIWPGNPALKDDHPLPDLPWREDPLWNSSLIQYFHVRSSHSLMSDNLLDLSHVAFLHAGSIGFEPNQLENDPLEVSISDTSIRTSRVFKNTTQAPAHRSWRRLQEPINRVQVAVWTPPGNVSVLSRNENSEDSVDLRADHFITPETSSTHHYYIALARNFRVDDEALSAQLDTDARRVHQEDVEIAEAQEAMRALTPDIPEMALKADKGITASHRILDALAEAER